MYSTTCCLSGAAITVLYNIFAVAIAQVVSRAGTDGEWPSVLFMLLTSRLCSATIGVAALAYHTRSLQYKTIQRVLTMFVRYAIFSVDKQANPLKIPSERKRVFYFGKTRINARL